MRLNILLKSLLENVIFFAQAEKKPYVRIEIVLTPKKALFTVENNGDYVKPKSKNDLFKMFTTYNNKSNGSGLGLYIARETIQNLNGKITYTSSPNRTVFKAIIPNISTEE